MKNGDFWPSDITDAICALFLQPENILLCALVKPINLPQQTHRKWGCHTTVDRFIQIQSVPEKITPFYSERN